MVGLIGLSILIILNPFGNQKTVTFDSDRAYKDLVSQVNQGPRIPGSQSHQIVAGWIQSELRKNQWESSVQEIVLDGKSIKNIIGQKGTQRPVILLGAHYDSRQFADQDLTESNHTQPVSGANDGASGVAVLLELSRTLPKSLKSEIWLVFFDAEDQGDIPGWSWIMGSKAFAQNLSKQPDYVVILDMIGDKSLNINYERNSNPDLMMQVWSTAASLGYSDHFIPEYKYSILDDHLPFIEKGIPAIDIIDFDYKYWHTTMDTIENTSPESLKIVGNTLYNWLTTVQ